MQTPVAETRRPDRLTLAAFAVLVTLGGANAVAIRYGNQELPPFWGAAIRFGLASLVFFAVAAIRRLALPRGRALLGALLYGVLGFGASHALAYWGLQRVEAGLAQVLVATVPLLTVCFALVHRVERFRWQALAGATLAIVGVGVVFGQGLGRAAPLASMLALLGAAACLAETGIVVKWFPPANPVATNAVAMAAGTGLLLALSALWGETPLVPTASVTWAALIYLVLVGSVAVFLLFLFVLQRWTASAASYQFVLAPFGTVALSAWLQGETVTLPFAIGGALVLAGVYVGAILRAGAATHALQPTLIETIAPLPQARAV